MALIIFCNWGQFVQKTFREGNEIHTFCGVASACTFQSSMFNSCFGFTDDEFNMYAGVIISHIKCCQFEMLAI